MSAVATAIHFRPDAPEFLRDPFPFLRRMREQDPVHWSPRLKSWVLTRYDDIKAVCLDREVSSDRLRPYFATLLAAESLSQWLFERIGQRREVDFVADFAGPLPALVIMAMLGVPREELAKVKRMSDEMALFIGSSRMEGQVALPAVLRHWKDIVLAVPEERIAWLNSMVFRGMQSLPLKVAA